MLERIHVPTLPFLTIKPTSSHLSVANNNISDDKVSEISKVELGYNDNIKITKTTTTMIKVTITIIFQMIKYLRSQRWSWAIMGIWKLSGVVLRASRAAQNLLFIYKFNF